MSDNTDNLKKEVSLIELVAALETQDIIIKQLKNKYNEPIAIIGMSCHFPGNATNLTEYWRMLAQGVDGITDIPLQRFNVDEYFDRDPDAPMKMYQRGGGFIDAVDMFDASFFAISPREALALDPQQRLLLELTWAAFEHAGVSAGSLAGSNTGVFVGMAAGDYNSMLINSPLRAQLEAHMVTGNAANAAAGRISYVFGLQGPSMTVDTACSSSLVAIHLACEHLRNSSCDTAIAAGVNVIASPEPYILLSRTRALAPDSHCKTFDKSADGYARGEGCGVILLKRLSDAIASGDTILATIRGSAVNQDGRSNSFTAPNGLMQEDLIREALEGSGIKPAQVSYIEAHGTGTPLGDPIEVHSLASVYSQGRDNEHPLIIGTVKANIGHTESAAGIAGVIKTVLAMQHKQIPAHLNFKELNPQIDLAQIPALIPTKLTPWDNFTDKRIAGVSAFGISGTNAHVILEEYVVEQTQTTEQIEATQNIKPPLNILCISAKTFDALISLSDSYLNTVLKDETTEINDLCYSAGVGREHFQQRIAVCGVSREQILQRLGEWRANGEGAGVVSGVAIEQANANIVFLFTGQGSQYIGMGRELYDSQPTFKQALDNCAQILGQNNYLDKQLLSLLWGEDSSQLDNTQYTQPALFALEYSLAKLWESWGITPNAVIGHSVGEYVAATVAGVLSLEDGLKLIAKRAQLMQLLPQNGAMVAIAASEDKALAAIDAAGVSALVSIAAINGPESIVISGDKDAVKKLAASFAAQNIKTKELQVSHAFHSHLLEPMLADFAQVLASIKLSNPTITLISNLTGQEINKDEITNSQYWLNHTRQAVRFADGIKTLLDSGYQHFIEIGPSPVLLGMAQESVPNDAANIKLWLPSLRKDKDAWGQILDSLGKLYVNGAIVNWSAFYQPYHLHKIPLPTYPFQRQSYWVEKGQASAYSSEGLGPILGHQLSSPLNQELVFESIYNIRQVPLLADHRVYHVVVVPAAFHISRIITWVVNVLGKQYCSLQDMAFDKAIVMQDAQSQKVQLC